MTLLLADEDIEQLISVEIAIDSMTSAFQLEGEGATSTPERFDVNVGNGWLRLMAVSIPGLDAFGFKAMNLVPRQGVRYAVWLYELSTGALRGVLDARIITAARTAATTAVATRALARPDVAKIALIGTGSEAKTHLTSIHHVRPAAQVSVHSRSPENRARFIDEMRTATSAELLDCASLEEAIEGADIVVLATKSSTPVLHRRHLVPGMHVNSIGSARGDQFELAVDAFEGFGTIVCDSAHHVFVEAGDAAAAVAAGVITAESATNLGDLVTGKAPGRRSPDEVTLFKSVGTATQDIALAARLYELAVEKGVGQDLGSFPTAKSL